MVVLYGDPDIHNVHVGKTTVLNAVISVLGIEACSFRGFRREFFIHLASQTSLGLLYHDPNKVNEVHVENLIIGFYNGMTRDGFKQGLETPRCGFLPGYNTKLQYLPNINIPINSINIIIPPSIDIHVFMHSTCTFTA